MSSRKQFLGAVAAVTAAAGSVPRSTKAMDFELDEVTVSKLQSMMDSGAHTAQSITALYLQRIKEVDKSGPAVNSVLELNPDAMAIAEELDEERKAKGPRGMLHGIPVLIKGNIGTHDRMSTTAGSLALAGSIPPEDSFIAKRLRAAGAVIIGKANLSEWANFRSTHSTSGWSAQGGLTRNPYALDRNPCGSSSGSAVAVSANLCALAVGTETNGSIMCPSSANGIVGIKPTVGLVSRSVIIPISHTQDSAGPMCRTVTDAAILLSALSGPDPDDPATAASRTKAFADYTRFLDPHGLRGARIGVARKLFGWNDRVRRLMEDAIDVMKREGATIVDPADLTTLGKWDDSENLVLLYEFKADLNRYLRQLGPDAPIRSLRDVIAFNEHHRSEEMPYFDQELFMQAERAGPLTSPKYRRALESNRRMTRIEGIDAVMERHRLDAIVAPTDGPAWITDLLSGDNDVGPDSYGAAAVAGYPSINVPAGFVFGLPVGMCFFGRAWSEPVLIKAAFGFEQATRHRRSPAFLKTANLP
jgi:amidase